LKRKIQRRRRKSRKGRRIGESEMSHLSL